MKAFYSFEQELLDSGYDFEPIQQGYDIDDLRAGDRQELSGMLWVLFKTLPAWKLRMETKYAIQGTLGKIAAEQLNREWDELEKYFLADVRDFVVSCLDDYESEEKDDGNE